MVKDQTEMNIHIHAMNLYLFLVWFFVKWDRAQRRRIARTKGNACRHNRHTHLHTQNWNCFVLTSTVWNKICALKQFGHKNRSWNLWHLSVTAHSKGYSVYERRGLISFFAFKYTTHHLFMLCEKYDKLLQFDQTHWSATIPIFIQCSSWLLVYFATNHFNDIQTNFIAFSCAFLLITLDKNAPFE